MTNVSRLCVILLFALTIAAPAEAQSGKTDLRPPGTDAVTNFPKNSVYLYWGAGFSGGDPHQIHPVTQEPPGRPQNFPDQKFLNNIRDDASSLKWNLPPGVIVVLFEDAAGKGEQIVIWGKGRLSSLNQWNFNDKVSRWAWYYVGGAEPPVPHIEITTPNGANPMSVPLPDSLQLWEDTDYRDDIEPITDVTGYAEGEFHRVSKELKNKMSSLRWDLPPGVIVLLAEKVAGKGKRITVWDRGQIPKLLHLDFNDEVSSWAWFSVVDEPLRTVCLTCKQPLDRGARFCPGCGVLQVQVKVCPFCATERPAGQVWKFCVECGEPWPRHSPSVD